jgi:C-terminal processing protease CtpA/Prc
MLAMKRCSRFALVFAFSLPLAGQNPPNQPAPSPRLTVQESLAFTPMAKGTTPNGWFTNPPATVSVDNQVVHSGRWSVRFDRNSASEGGFSVITKSIPVDFAGRNVELHGYFRTKDVAGYAGLWMREDGEGQMLKLENMASQHVDGTRDWTEYSIKLPIDGNARQLVFGVLLAGTGTLWVDDLRLLVDGEPIAEAKAMDRPLTVLDTDHQFDKGSQIALSSLTPNQIDNLFALGRVWGFLKYHHPAVTAGKRQWDYDLLRILPAILAAPDGAHANDILVHWIDGLGEIPACDASQCPAEPANDLNLKPDLAWIHDSTTLGSALSMRLQRIYQSRPRDQQFYVAIPLYPLPANPSFNHELSYSAVTFPDSGFQLLALFRWWNIMQFWAPYRVDSGQNWPAVLAEFIPKLALAKDRTAYQLAMFELIAKANDTHANLWSSLDVRPPVGKCELPIDMRFIDGQSVVTGFVGKDTAANSTLRIGDIIDALDGTPIATLTGQWTPFYADSNVAARRRDMARYLTRGDCKPVTIEAEQDGKRVALRIDRQPERDAGNPRWHDLPGDTFRLLSPDVAYLKLSSIKAADIPGYLQRAANTRGLIIDIRNYPSEFVPFALGSYLVKGHTSFATFTVGDVANPGAFNFRETEAIDPAPGHYNGKVVILVDETSISQAEYTAMALRAAPNAIVVGSTTAGADGNVSAIPLPGGLNTMISGIGVFYPDHRPTQRIGVVPDVEAKPTVAGIKAGRDEVLETAIRQILGPGTAETAIEKLANPDTAPKPTPTK